MASTKAQTLQYQYISPWPRFSWVMLARDKEQQIIGEVGDVAEQPDNDGNGNDGRHDDGEAGKEVRAELRERRHFLFWPSRSSVPKSNSRDNEFT